MMKINITPLKDALLQLEKSMNYLKQEKDPDLKEQFRNSAIQCFEFTYELSYKMVRRHLEQIVSTPEELRQMNFADFIRTGAEAGVVPDVKRFLRYRDRRNMTSHTYNRKKAEEVVAVLDDFAKDIHFIVNKMEKKDEAK